MVPDTDDGIEAVSGGSLEGWMPVIRSVCEAYMKLPNEVALLTLDQVLLLCLKKGILVKRGEVGWSFEGNIAVMEGGNATKRNIKGAERRKDKSYFQHVLEQQRKAKPTEPQKGKRRGRQTS